MTLANFEMVQVTGTCEKHGDWEARAFAGKKQYARCPECTESEKRKEISDHDRVLARLARQRALREATIPRRYQGKTLSDCVVDDDNRKAVELCRRYVKKLNDVVDRGVSLCFCGKPGTGKTHLAAGIVLEALSNDIQAKYTTVVEMIREVKSTYRKNSDLSEVEVIERYSKIKMLVLDEVGMQIGSDTEKLILSEIINNRYGNVLPTIMISNLGITELREYIGDRIIDRMREGGGAVVSFDWDSKRSQI